MKQAPGGGQRGGVGGCTWRVARPGFEAVGVAVVPRATDPGACRPVP